MNAEKPVVKPPKKTTRMGACTVFVVIMSSVMGVIMIMVMGVIMLWNAKGNLMLINIGCLFLFGGLALIILYLLVIYRDKIFHARNRATGGELPTDG